MRYILAVSAFFLFSFSIVTGQPIEVKSSRAIISNFDKPITDLNINLDEKKIIPLGYKNIDELNLLGDSKRTSINKISDFNPHTGGKFYNFQYDDIFVMQCNNDADINTLNSNPKQNLELYYTIKAIDILKTRYNEFYQKLILNITNPVLQSSKIESYYSHWRNNTNNSENYWINRYPKIIISFNRGSSDVAISGTYLDPAPINFTINKNPSLLYENFPIVSINSENIKGSNKDTGSYPIYKKTIPEDNYSLYLKEGLLHSICHELIHRYIDINNNKQKTIFNYISFGNGRKNRSDSLYDKKLYNIEEAMVNQTLDNYFRKVGGISLTLLDYYMKVQTDNLGAIQNLDEYKKQMKDYSNLNQDLSLNL